MKKLITTVFVILLMFGVVKSQTDSTIINNDEGNDNVIQNNTGQIGQLEINLSNLQKGLEDFQNQIMNKQIEIQIWTDSIQSYSLKFPNDTNKLYNQKVDSLNILIDINNDIIEALNEGIEDITESIQEVNDDMQEIQDEIKDETYSFDYDYNVGDDDKCDKKKKFKGHWAGVNLGLNTFLAPQYEFSLPQSSDFMAVDLAKSWEIAVNPVQFSLPFFNRYVGAVTGVGLNFNNYELLHNVTLLVDSTGSINYELFNNTYKKNRFKTASLTIPLILEFQIPVNKKDKRIFISAGVIGSMNMQTKFKTIYIQNGTENRYKDKSSNWPVNKFSYTATARIGFDDLYIFANYTPKAIFETSKGPELYQFSAGIGHSF